MQAEDFAPIVELIVATWPATERWPDATWDVWLAELEPYAPALVEQVIRAHADLQFAPTWPLVRRACAVRLAHHARQAALRKGAEEGQW